MILSNYELIEKISESPKATIFKAYNKKNPSRLLILKVIKTPLSDNKKAQILQKIEHLKILNDRALITPISFSDRNNTCFITEDYFDGVTLNKFLEREPEITLNDFLTIASALAQSIEKIHEAGIIHGGIKPHNILVNPITLEIRLVDFVSALEVQDVSHFIYEKTFIRESLAYTSPEQTGRINHRVVFSSDLYSLGIVFYEMLTGRLPFLSDDPLELIHHHLAREAPKIHELNPKVPIALCQIVTKLMLKEPEKRYQRSKGLYDDLQHCKEELIAMGNIVEFPLEKSITTHRTTFISKMVGRDREAEIILGEYEKVAQGEFRSLLISGLSGIGKTRLIQELQKPIVKHRGYFTSGKFDVYQKNIPYSSLIQALSNLVRTFLTESDERVAAWKSKILVAVGQNGKVLTNVIPELEILIGTQPEVRPLPPVESLNRFHDTFDRFLCCLASEDNPLTLFIDDLQWCDVASFDFLTNLLSNYQDHPYLLFLGAYRHNEVDSSHPLTKLIRNIKENGQPLKEIRLGPLKPENCHEMVSYILDSPLQETKTLADFITALTEGNPLFVSESLSYLHNEDLLYLDADRQWRWDIEKIRHSSMPTSVVALFSSKIQKFQSELKSLLEFCACMGNMFSPTELSLIRETPLVEIFETLKPALGEGLLIENKNQLQFIHDKVQEAALSAIPTQSRREIHWRVGNHLLYGFSQDSDEIEKIQNLFTILSHLNLGRAETLDKETAYSLSDLNYHAGNKALYSLATEAANEYFNKSKELLPESCWDNTHYERTFRIYQKAAKTELMCGNYEKSEKLLTQLLEHAKSDLDKAECLAEQTTSLSSIGNFIKAIATANKGLAYFDKAIPENPDEADKKRYRLMNEIASKNIDVWNTILNMPFTKDRKSKIELAFYSELIPDLYMSGLPSQLYLSAAQSTQHCLAGGMDESVIYSFSIMGLQLGEEERFEEAFKYEDLARDLSAKHPNTFGATRGMNGIVWCNMHSRSHPKDIVDYCLKAIQCGKNCGDLYNAGLSYGPLMWNLQVQGADFLIIEDYAKECLQFSNRYHLSFSVGLAEAMLAGWIEPMKKGYFSSISMAEKLSQWEKDNHVASAGSYFVHLAMVSYYFGEYEEAQKHLDSVRKYLSGLTDNVLKRQWHIFRALNALKLHERGLVFKSKGELDSEIRPIIEKIENWASLGPLLQPYLAFLYAELEIVSGDFREARSLYIDAINTANEYGYVFLEGYLNECLGELLSKRNQPNARMFFGQAVKLYRQCHADRKEAEILGRFSDFEEQKRPYISLEVEPSIHTLPDLDVEYLMKSALAISAEIEQEALLKKILNLVIESSGAQHGYLLTEQDGGLFVRAESHGPEKEAVVICSKQLEEAKGICKAIVRYVQRSGQRIILNNASAEGDFKDNPEVQDMKLRSVLCLPIIKQSITIGLLYLENNLAESVFTPGKTGMTEMLTLQAAISLENSALFDERRKAEEALKESEVKFRTVADFTYGWEYWITPHGRFIYVSPASTRITGYSPEEFMESPELLESIIFEKDRELIGGHFERFDDLEPHNVEFRIIRRDGEMRWIAHICQAVFRPDGKMIGRRASNRDITVRKQAEEALRKSEQRWATTLSSIGDAVIASDTEGKITFMNAVAEELTGWSLREAAQKPVKQVFNIVNEFTRNVVDDPVNKVLSKGMIVGLANHTVLLRRDGTEVPIDDSGAPIRNEKGKITGVVLVFRDITERKKAEDALRRSQDQIKFITNAVPALLSYVDANCRYLWANESYEDWFGYSPEKIQGKHIRDVLGEKTYEKIVPYIKQVLSGQTVTFEEELHVVSGNLWAHACYTPDMCENGQVRGFIIMANDISERKKAEGELWKAKNDWERTFDSVPDLIAILDNNHRVVRANKAMAQALNTTTEKCIGLSCYKCVHGADSPPSFCPHTKAVSDGKEHTEEVHEARLGGDFIVSATPLTDENGQMIGSVHVARDITSRKQMQNKLEEYSAHLEDLVQERTNALKDAERMATIGATAGMVGHDIRNPLQSILGDVFLASSELDTLPDSESKTNIKESLDEIVKSLDYVSKIVADLQDFAKPLKPSMQEIDLHAVCKDILSHTPIPSGISVTCNFDEHARVIQADPTLLKRVLGNLVINAVQAMPQGGTLKIMIGQAKGNIIISVQDTGVGIPEEARNRIFTPLFTTKSKGQGFGLAVVKRMTEALNGEITFESKVGLGTTFIIRFPINHRSKQ